jgi:CheY-like chemotaxis protein
MQLNPNEAAQEFLDQAASACRRATFLSSQLLTFAKGGTPVRRVASIATLVTDAVQLARTGSPISIEVDIAEGLWFAEVDPGQISQVLHNVLLNARQSMPGGGTIEVRALNVAFPNSRDGADPRVRISIRDQGSGISAEVIGRIFDPYFTTKQDGSGLGLATAYAIVVKHGGHISAESTPGAGTVFTIDLPAAPETAIPQAPMVVTMQTGTEHLLVMDDDETLRILFKAVLTKLGYDVQTARDGAEAIALFEARKAEGRGFDAVLLDLTVIGGMGGMETAVKLKELDPSSKLIVSSGYSDAPVMSDFGEYGFDAVILKPWTVTEMSEVLRRVLVTDDVANPRS